MTKTHFFFISILLFASMQLIAAEENEKKCEAKKEEKNDKEENKKEKDKDEKEKNEEKEEEQEIEPPKILNFSFPSSQQPSALIGIGGKVIDQGVRQLYFTSSNLFGKKLKNINITPAILFGIRNDLSIFFNFPFTPWLQNGKHKSDGIEDLFVQLEYAFYGQKTACYVDQATVLGNIAFDTGSIHKNPPTGFGSPNFLLGATYYRVMIEWLFFASYGAVLTTSNHGTKFGNQFLYQCGMGKNFYSTLNWIYVWMLELDGTYSKQDRLHGKINRNSGGNVVTTTPSIYISSKNVFFQLGVSLPINQNLFKRQRKFDYDIIFQTGWTFYPRKK